MQGALLGPPFAYTTHGQTAELRGTPPKGEEANAAFNVRVVVTVRK